MVVCVSEIHQYPVFVLILLWLLLSLFEDAFGLFSQRKSYEISTDLSNDLFVLIFSRLLMLPLKFHKEKKMGRIMRRIDRGIDDLSNFIERTLFTFLPQVVSFFVALVILLFVEWRLSLILIFASILYILVTFIYTRDIVKKQRRKDNLLKRLVGKRLLVMFMIQC